MLDMLTFPPNSFASFLDDNHMDNLFTLGSMAISAALDDYVEGYLAAQDLHAEVWWRYYFAIVKLIERMQRDKLVRSWLDEYQHNLLDWVQACLHRHGRPTCITAHVDTVSNNM